MALRSSACTSATRLPASPDSPASPTSLPRRPLLSLHHWLCSVWELWVPSAPASTGNVKNGRESSYRRSVALLQGWRAHEGLPPLFVRTMKCGASGAEDSSQAAPADFHPLFCLPKAAPGDARYRTDRGRSALRSGHALARA